MTLIFNCPACGADHDDPAEGSFVLAVPCLDCDLVALLEQRSSAAESERRAIPAAA